MKITKKRDSNGLGSYYKFTGKFVNGRVWWDGSGYIEGKSYFSESGTHEQRIQEIENIIDSYRSALKELKQLKKKIKFSIAEKRGD